MPELPGEPVPDTIGGPRTAGPGRGLAHARIRPRGGRCALADGRRATLAAPGKAAYCTWATVPTPDGRSHSPRRLADQRVPDAGAAGIEGSISDIMRLISAGGM